MPSAHLSFRLKPSRPISHSLNDAYSLCPPQTRRKDHAVQFKLLAISNHAVFGETPNSPTIGIDKVYARQIKARQIFIVETRSLTELPVIRL